MIKHHKIISTAAITTLLAVSLSGCLVKKEDPKPPVDNKSDNLRVYEPGEWISYNVLATVLSGSSLGDTLTGTLEIRWGNYASLLSPDGKSYDVIEKLVTVDMDLSDGTTPPATQHYVHMDADGTEHLVAMGHPKTGQYYWLNTVGGKNEIIDGVPGAQEPVTLMRSPLAVGQQYPVTYYLMDDCTLGTAGCQTDVGTSNGTGLNSIDIVGKNKQIDTSIGNFSNPYEINFEGSITPAAGIQQLPLLFSIFDVCSDGISTHSGTMFIVPEIGIIKLDNTCTALDGNGDSITYNITIDSTSASIQ